MYVIPARQVKTAINIIVIQDNLWKSVIMYLHWILYAETSARMFVEQGSLYNNHNNNTSVTT